MLGVKYFPDAPKPTIDHVFYLWVLSHVGLSANETVDNLRFVPACSLEMPGIQATPPSLPPSAITEKYIYSEYHDMKANRKNVKRFSSISIQHNKRFANCALTYRRQRLVIHNPVSGRLRSRRRQSGKCPVQRRCPRHSSCKLRDLSANTLRHHCLECPIGGGLATPGGEISFMFVNTF